LVRACPRPFSPVHWRKVGEALIRAAISPPRQFGNSHGAGTPAGAPCAPYFVKIAKGLRLGYYRGSIAGTWIGRRYLGDGSYETDPLGLADDTTNADGVKVLDYWQAQETVRRWAERNRFADVGMILRGPYSVADAVRDYLEEITAEKPARPVRDARTIFENSVLPEPGHLLAETLTTDRLVRWRNTLAARPMGVRKKRTATVRATRAVANTDEARRKRKATANRSLTMLKAALNRAFHGGRVLSDTAWRKVKPFARVEKPVIRYLSAEEGRRLVNACPREFRRMVQAALLSGCRYSELTNLRCADSNSDSDTLTIRQAKAGKARHMVLTGEGRTLFTGWTAGRLVEGMLAAQLVACHNASMECYRRAMIGEQTFEGHRESLSQANKLGRTFSVLLDALNHHRGKGQQKVTVEHVHVHEGGQAIVGNVGTPGGGDRAKSEDQPMQGKLSTHLSRRCRARTRRESLCQSPAMPNGRCRMHGGMSPGAPKGNRNALKHGRYTADAIARRREIGALLRAVRTLITEET
jgi:integrase